MLSLPYLSVGILFCLQFQNTHSHVEEMDVCGLCRATYEVIDARTILKLKKDCRSHLLANQHPEPVIYSLATISNFTAGNVHS